MFKNYFKIALRNLARNKIYSFINIAGLSIGLACAMLIILYVKDEVSLRRFHKNVNNIYRIVTQSIERTERKEKIEIQVICRDRDFAQNVPGHKSICSCTKRQEDIKTGTEVKDAGFIVC